VTAPAPDTPLALSAYLEAVALEHGFRDPLIEVGVARNVEGLRYRVMIWPRIHVSRRTRGAVERYSKVSYAEAAAWVLDTLRWRTAP